MRRLIVLAALLGCYPALLVAALWPAPLVFGAVALASYAAEYAAPRLARRAAELPGRVHLGVTLRFAARETAALLLVARTAGAGSAWFVALAVAMFGVHGVRAAHTGLALRLRQTLAHMPITTRNLDVSALRIPRMPPGWLRDPRSMRFLYLDALPVLAAVQGAVAACWGAAVALAAGLAGAFALVPYVRRARPLTDRARVIEVVGEQVAAHRPEVILYFSGATAAAYQARMWLPVLERLNRRAIVVLRERGMAQHLEPSSLPMVCIPSAADLMSFRALFSAKLCLYVSNVGRNVHMLRIPTLRSAFLNHGDSDKEASFNPFSRVYDEVWVAGPAGRDRYRRAKVGVRDECIHEVGRPQLQGISTEGPGLPHRTVLYAPTWEGWNDDLFHTSLITMGPRLVRALLDHDPPLRVIYKPHPLTGHRDKAALRAHRRIVAMMEAAELAESKARHPSRAEAGGTRVRHLVVTGPQPHLYECFNQCDLLISDISSVVADFLASEKPYAVTNVAGLPERAFHERYPSTEAGVLLGEDLAGLAEFLDGEDTLARARIKLRSYLLGPEYPDAMTRFSAAVERVIAES
ncbi:CDP-glycerol glycerophosphotransferase family protein [Actinomadura sp. ATCC 31491]|uniref:CDP-glycerol glycerophosphotransferase family protein n=1 Tax=Actinomadura luzonensis TaxID=2805427 RepID=A0ABT0G9E8_9ACTN|nr:CDP-glycerol glycerophosphotransferase family protein [Actinomadura luzonensis]MCK2221222.1 CDP-glycerol glycerophosphotransferase family protein [Actinomadura luzonensis]